MPMPKIHKHKKGGCYMNATFGGKRVSIYGKTEAEVEQKYIEKTYEYGLGIKPGQKVTVAEYLRTWLASKEPDLAPYTYEGYRGNIENHIIPAFGKKNVQDVIPADIQALYADKRKERKAVADEKKKLRLAKEAAAAAVTDSEKTTAQALLKAVDMKLAKKEALGETSLLYIHRILTAAFNDAVGNRMIRVNPADGVKAPKKTKIKKTPPDECGVKELYQSVRGKEFELATHMAVALGLRRGEICAALWSDVDFKEKIIYINKGMVQTARTGLIVKDSPKDNEPRDVNIPDSVIRLMQAERKRQEADAEIMGEAYHSCENIARHRDGTPFTPYSLSMCINRAIKAAGIKTTLHGLRGTYESILYKFKADPKAVTDSLGHSTETFSRDNYQSVYGSMKKELADIMEAAIYTEDDAKSPANLVLHDDENLH